VDAFQSHTYPTRIDIDYELATQRNIIRNHWIIKDITDLPERCNHERRHIASLVDIWTKYYGLSRN
jgi:hypothetical protein